MFNVYIKAPWEPSTLKVFPEYVIILGIRSVLWGLTSPVSLVSVMKRAHLEIRYRFSYRWHIHGDDIFDIMNTQCLKHVLQTLEYSIVRWSSLLVVTYDDTDPGQHWFITWTNLSSEFIGLSFESKFTTSALAIMLNHNWGKYFWNFCHI